MNRRSSRSLRVENFLYDYDLKNSKWVPKSKFIVEDLFKSGVFYSCKRMAQKVSPIGFRLKLNRFWSNLWTACPNNYSTYLQQDLVIRTYISNVFNNLGFGVGKLLIYRFHNKLFLKVSVRKFRFLSKQNIYVPQWRALEIYTFFKNKIFNFGRRFQPYSKATNVYNPLFFKENGIANILGGNNFQVPVKIVKSNGVFFDSKNQLTMSSKQSIGANDVSISFLKKRFSVSESTYIESSSVKKEFLFKQPLKQILKNALEQFSKTKVFISLVEESNILNSAAILNEILLNELKYSRNSFRNILINVFKDISDLKHVKGIRVNCSGRLSKTTTMAQTEWFRIGQIPLTTLTAHVDYASGSVKTKTGLCGVKVWIFYKNNFAGKVA
jgi:ribosomal protein S3